ncbi:MAG: response regulator [Alphaproteobacteria bacterium]|nr:response regulator [Alphaproteobacteria bacterium]
MAHGRRTASGRGRRAIEVALAGLAHDIRTPLTGILALADLLASSDLPARERRWADSIKDTADHLARLTTIVVDAVRAETAGLVLREEPFSARDLARSVAASLGARAETKGLKVDVAIAADLPARALGDALRLRSALENLCDNAVKFTERGRIGFTAQASRAARGRTRLTFEVSDSGIGIVEADLRRLFKPFSQASEQVALRYGGAGLGLVFVKRIAEAMGGGLTVKSAPGRGSTFRLSVTVKDAAPAARPRTNGALRRLRVLCAEDNPYGRMVLKAVLGELGHSVSFVGTGEAAVEEAARNKHDVVLMDVALAGIDGIEAARRIRALPPPAGRVPIVGVSGRTEANDAVAAKAAGMDAYLRKPASPADLNDALRTVSAVRRV